MSEEETNDHELRGCFSTIIRLIAGPLSIVLFWTIGRPFVEKMNPGEFFFALFVLLFLIGLLEGSLRSSNRNKEDSIEYSSLVGYAILFSFLQCVATIVLAVAVLFLACASGNIGY